MSLNVIIHRAAKAEFIEASKWYESKRLGLGREFIDEIEHCIKLAAEYPQRYKIIQNNLRRVVANRFPYSVYFCYVPERIVVLAIFHSSRNPRIWQSRI